jgi:uncharacterized secreted protein with C-terminal beta-propeller domain
MGRSSEMINFRRVKRQVNRKLAVSIALGASLIAMLISIACSSTSPTTFAPKIEGVERFSSEAEFRAYLEEGADTRTQYYGFMMPVPMPKAFPPLGFGSSEDLIGGELAVPSRISETTVQVIGVDEPDIVKTDGKEIYFSQSYFWRGGVIPMLGEQLWPVPQEGKTRVIRAFPPEDLAVEASIDKQGELLLVGDIR